MPNLLGKLFYICTCMGSKKNKNKCLSSLNSFWKASSCLISTPGGRAAVLEEPGLGTQNNGLIWCQPYTLGDPGQVMGTFWDSLPSFLWWGQGQHLTWGAVRFSESPRLSVNLSYSEDGHWSWGRGQLGPRTLRMWGEENSLAPTLFTTLAVF